MSKMVPKTKFAENLEQDQETLEYQMETQFLAVTEEICAIMEMQKLKRKDFAEAMGVKLSCITDLLSGKKSITLLTLVKISRALGVKLTVTFGSPLDAERAGSR